MSPPLFCSWDGPRRGGDQLEQDDDDEPDDTEDEADYPGGRGFYDEGYYGEDDDDCSSEGDEEYSDYLEGGSISSSSLPPGGYTTWPDPFDEATEASSSPASSARPSKAAAGSAVGASGFLSSTSSDEDAHHAGAGEAPAGTSRAYNSTEDGLHAQMLAKQVTVPVHPSPGPAGDQLMENPPEGSPEDLPCYEVSEEEFSRLIEPDGPESSLEAPEYFEVSEEELEQLVLAGRLQPAAQTAEAEVAEEALYEVSDSEAGLTMQGFDSGADPFAQTGTPQAADLMRAAHAGLSQPPSRDSRFSEPTAKGENRRRRLESKDSAAAALSGWAVEGKTAAGSACQSARFLRDLRAAEGNSRLGCRPASLPPGGAGGLPPEGVRPPPAWIRPVAAPRAPQGRPPHSAQRSGSCALIRSTSAASATMRDPMADGAGIGASQLRELRSSVARRGTGAPRKLAPLPCRE